MPKGKIKVTDQEIVDMYTAGKFIGEIRKKSHVGKNRIYKVLDEAGLRNGVEARA